MNINCIICSDLLTPTAEIYVTSCGHLFHYLCLIQWIERSTTCPQCRNKTTEKSIHRIYLNLSNADNTVSDVGTLQNKFDNLQFQVNLKNKEVKTHNDKFENIKAKNANLRTQAKELENKIRASQSKTHELKEEVTYLRHKSKECNKLEKAIVSLKEKLKDVEDMELVLNGSNEQVNDMLQHNRDPYSLGILASLLKRKLIETDRKNKQISSDLKHAQQSVSSHQKEIMAVQQENDKLKLDIETHKNCAKERQHLKRKICDLEAKSATLLYESSKPKIRRMLTESPTPIPKKSLMNDSRVVFLDETISPSVSERVQQIKESDSPYLHIKLSNIGILPSSLNSNYTTLKSSVLPHKGFKTLNILEQSQKKHLKLPDEGYSYNGLGGHSKVEHFPSPRPSNEFKSKSSTVVSKKYNKVAPNKKLHEFFLKRDE